MNKVSALLVIVLFFVTLHLNAQTQTNDYFVGKWEVLIQGPEGDIKMFMNIERKDGILEGVFTSQNSEDALGALPMITKIAENEQNISVYFDTDYGDVYMIVGKVDDNNIKGIIMDMFDITGNRVSQ